MNEYDITIDDKKIVLDIADLSTYDLEKLSHQQYHALADHESYHGIIHTIDISNKEVVLTLNDKLYRCTINEEIDRTIQSMSLRSTSKNISKHLVASMPGLVLSLSVDEGDTVSKGDTLMIIEAMKMENVLKASADGVIKRISCQEKDAVEKGQILIEIE